MKWSILEYLSYIEIDSKSIYNIYIIELIYSNWRNFYVIKEWLLKTLSAAKRVKLTIEMCN